LLTKSKVGIDRLHLGALGKRKAASEKELLELRTAFGFHIETNLSVRISTLDTPLVIFPKLNLHFIFRLYVPRAHIIRECQMQENASCIFYIRDF